MNVREKHKMLGSQIIELKQQMNRLYDQTKVKVKPGDIVESLDFGNGKTFMYFVFLDSWKKELCYVQVSNGGSCGYNQVCDGVINGTLVVENGYDFVLSKYKEESVSDIIIESFKRMVYEPKRHICLHQRLCHWCGQSLTNDMAN